MVRLFLCMAPLFSSVAWSAPALQCGPQGVAEGERLVERINRRYDDFYRFRRVADERNEKREKARDEGKELRKQRAERLENARKDYVKNRRPPPDRRDLELRHEREQKERVARQELARRCFVQQREEANRLLSRGRKIPGNLEFDIED